MADKIVVMHDGRVEQIGAPLELYDRPDNLFVAGFIGSPAMNMLAGTVDPDDRTRFVTGDGIGAADRPPGRRRARRSTWSTACGPRSIHLGGDVPLRVDVVEPTGSETHVARPPRRRRGRRRVPRAHLGAARARRSGCRSTRAPRICSTPRSGARISSDADTDRDIAAGRIRSGPQATLARVASQPTHPRQGGSSRWPSTAENSMAGAAGLGAAAALGTGRAFAQSGADLHPRGGRLAAPAALGAVRRRRGGGLERQHQGLHRRHRRRGPHRPGKLGGRAPQGRRRRQRRLRARTW